LQELVDEDVMSFRSISSIEQPLSTQMRLPLKLQGAWTTDNKESERDNLRSAK